MGMKRNGLASTFYFLANYFFFFWWAQCFYLRSFQCLKQCHNGFLYKTLSISTVFPGRLGS